VGELLPPDQPSWGTVHTGIHVSVEILGNKAGGRLFLLRTYKSEWGKAIAFPIMLQKKSLWFLYFKKKSKLPLDMWGANF